MATQADVKPHAVERISRAMARHPTFCALTLVFILSVLSNYVKSLTKPVVIQQPLPKRFFPSSSLVLDYPYGNIGDVGDLLTEREALFIMYYAPWCAKSIEVRDEFQKAAEYMNGDLQFVGVNAWYPNGTCRQHNNFVNYPVLFFYHINRDGYQYTGIFKAEYIIQFAYRMLYPLKYIYSREELVSFLANSDNAVLGYFDFSSSPEPLGFLQFYYASLRLYESDPRNPVEFGVITSSEIASLHRLHKSGTIHINRSLNSTLRYPSTYNVTARNISKWVLYHKQELSVSWLLPSGSKSSVLSSQLKTPAVILFLPYYPLSYDSQYASVFHEIALDYYNCNNLTHIPQVINTLTYLRWISALNQLDVNLECQNVHQVEPACRSVDRMIPTKRCCQSIMVDPSYTEYNSCDVCLNYLQTNPVSWLPCDMKSVLDMPLWPNLLESFPTHQGVCAELMPYYHPGEILTLCCENHSYYNSAFSGSYAPHGAGRQSNDPFVINSVKNRHRKLCDQVAYQRKHGWETPMSEFLSTADNNITGFSCMTNRTLKFLMMDTRETFIFAQRLGIDITAKSKEPVLVIFDKQMEEQFIMKSPFTKSHIIDFIHNFTELSLKRSWRSVAVQSDQSQCDNKGSKICIVDINSDNFKEVVMDVEKDVVLLYHTPWCGYCISFNHIYLSLAKYFRHSQNIIFGRVDASRNDLPWQYTMDVYPTLVLFPAYRKSESVAFPSDLDKSLPNLIYFILQYSSTSLKLHTGLSICSRTCIAANLESTVHRIHLLNHGIAKLIKSRRALQSKIRMAKNKALRGSSGDSGSSSGHGDLSVLQWYNDVIMKRIWLKRLQLSEARHLHKVLLDTRGPFIEQHKLSTILMRYTAYKQRYDRFESIYDDQLKVSISTKFSDLESSHDEA